MEAARLQHLVVELRQSTTFGIALKTPKSLQIPSKRGQISYNIERVAQPYLGNIYL